ncbi:RsfA family transcriptional regulator [Alteribacillus iranensis]|uniref:Prespore-specific regulator n=1 Tax=Alteribacillus iranensis TaxID=930128 RepID=A0A1I2ABA7_9BACI|nr:RsfA family transcriptional regulator [Alteribacillus iranensis]SFE41176.1 prespore-specific regulator [Alteribacillus iranensis]
MTVSRQDAWSADDDILLAEIVLRHVREGSTQLAAFEEAGKKLSRTAAACGFRWNACIRKKYDAAIELARKQREHKSKQTPVEITRSEIFLEQEDISDNTVSVPSESSTMGSKRPDSLSQQLKETIQFLKQVSQHVEKNNQLEITPLLEKKQTLENEKEQLKRELEKVKKDFNRLREDYRALLEVMDKARALSEGALPYLKEEESIKESG